MATVIALTLEWASGDWPPRLSGVILPPLCIFVLMLAMSPLRERRGRERRLRSGHADVAHVLGRLRTDEKAIETATSGPRRVAPPNHTTKECS